MEKHENINSVLIREDWEKREKIGVTQRPSMYLPYKCAYKIDDFEDKKVKLSLFIID